MSGSTPIWILLTLIAAGAAVLLLVSGGSEEADGPTGVDVSSRARSGFEETARPDAEEPTPKTAPVAESAEPPVVAPPAPEERPWPLPPELLVLPAARWDDARARDVLDDIARQTGLELRMSMATEKVLDTVRVTLDLADVKGSIVLSRVLLPLDLNYTVRDGVLMIFPDDD